MPVEHPRQHCCLVAALFFMAVVCLPAVAQDAADWSRWEPVQYGERPGERVFSGELICRPKQYSALVATGLTAEQASALQTIAHVTMSTYAVGRYVWETDEYIIICPEGRHENDVANELLRLGCFEYVEPNWILSPVVVPNDPLITNQWHHAVDRMQSFDAWDLHTGNPTVGVGICDTGVLVTHEDLLLHRLEGYNAVDRLFESQGGSIGPVHPHGTQTTGCAAGNGNNGVGISGVGWNLSHRMLRVSNLASGNASLADLQDAARTAVQSGDRVASVSFSGVDTASNLTTATFIKSIGGLLVWAAGNDGRFLTFGNRDADDIIVVGATDQNDLLASFSARGPFVDVTAPGVGVVTATSTTNASYAAVSGTSFSTPLTAGLIALIWSSDPSLTPDQVEQRLKGGVDDLGAIGIDDTFGYGRINSFGSLSTGGAPAPPIADAGPDLAVSDADGDGLAAVTLDGSGSFDPDGGPVSHLWSEDAVTLGTTAILNTTLVVGPHTIVLTVTDDELQTGSDIVLVTVNPNLPPVAAAGPDSTVLDTDGDGVALVSLDGTGSFDPDGSILSFEWTEGASLLGTSPIVEVLLGLGDHLITLSVTDNGGASSSDTVLLTVTEQGPQAIASDGFESGNFTGGTGVWLGGWTTRGGDVRNQVGTAHTGSRHVRFRKVGSGMQRTADVTGATALHVNFWSRTQQFEGTDSFRVRVGADGGPLQTIFTWTTANSNTAYAFFDFDLSTLGATNALTIDFDSNMDKGRLFLDDVEVVANTGPPPNQSPVANAGGDVLVGDSDGTGVETVTLDGSGSFDPDGLIAAFEWSEGGLVLGTLPLLTADFTVGTHAVILTVTDDVGATATDTALVDVNPNQPPVADAGPNIDAADADGNGAELVTLDGSGSFDPDGSLVAVEWREGATVLGSTTVLQISLGVGVHSITLTVTDNAGATTSDPLIATVAANQPPISDAGPDQTVFDGNGDGIEIVTLDGTASSDADGVIVSYEWREGAVVLGSSSNLDVPLGLGPHTISLTVTDSGSSTATDTLVVTVTAPVNQPPTANAGPDVSAGDPDGDGLATVTLDGTASFDPEGPIASFLWTEGATTLGTTAVINVSLGVSVHTVTLTVTDPQGLSASDIVVVTVTANQPPTANAGADQTVNDGDNDGVATVLLDGTASFDPDGSLVGFEWREGATVLATTASPSFLLTVGAHVITLTVTDNGGVQAFDLVNVTVTPFSNDPVVIASDGFESGNFTGGSGWSGAWITGGDLRIRGENGPHGGSQHARLRKTNGSMTRTVGLVGASSVSLRVWVKAQDFEGADNASLEVRADGGVFTTVATWTTAESDNTYRLVEFDLSSLAFTSTVTVRVAGDLDKGFLWVDDVEIVGVPGG